MARQEIPVGEHHPFGATGGAARVNEHEGVFGRINGTGLGRVTIKFGEGESPLGWSVHHHHGLQLRESLPDRPDFGPGPRLHEGDRDLGVPKLMMALLSFIRGIHGNRDCPQPAGRDHPLDKLGPIMEAEAHSIPFLNAKAPEAASQSQGALPEGAMGDRSIIKDYRRLLRALTDRRLDEGVPRELRNLEGTTPHSHGVLS